MKKNNNDNNNKFYERKKNFFLESIIKRNTVDSCFANFIHTIFYIVVAKF